MIPEASIPYGATMAHELPAGERGSEETLARMAAMVHDTDHGQLVHDLAMCIVAGEARDREQAIRIFDFLRHHVTFARDTLGRELLRHPEQLVYEINQRGVTAGDCDDRSMLGAALLRAIGQRAAFVVMSRRDDGAWQHVAYAALRPQASGPPRAEFFDPQLCAASFTLPPHLRRKVYAL